MKKHNFKKISILTFVLFGEMLLAGPYHDGSFKAPHRGAFRRVAGHVLEVYDRVFEEAIEKALAEK